MARFGYLGSIACTAVATAGSLLSAPPNQANGTGTPGFTTTLIPVGGDPDAIAVADLNRDGAADIVLANPESGTVTVMLGDGRGHFRKAAGSPFPAGHLPSDVGVGDFNGDGNPDLLVPNHQTPYVTLLLGDGRGSFHPAPHSPFATDAQPHPHGLAVGHFCGKDQQLDAVIDSWGSKEVELLLGDGKGNLRNGPKFPAGPGSDLPLRSADFNGDGIPDVAIADTDIGGHWDANTVTVLLGDGKCGFTPAPGSPFAAGAAPWSVAVGDMNNDGSQDLLLTPYGPQVHDASKIAATILLGDGRGGFHQMPNSPVALPGCSPRRVAIGGVHRGKPTNFAVTCMNSSTIMLFVVLEKGGLQVSPYDVPTGSSRTPVGQGILFADLLGRGRDDVIVSNGSAGTITLLMGR